MARTDPTQQNEAMPCTDDPKDEDRGCSLRPFRQRFHQSWDFFYRRFQTPLVARVIELHATYPISEPERGGGEEPEEPDEVSMTPEKIKEAFDRCAERARSDAPSDAPLSPPETEEEIKDIITILRAHKPVEKCKK